jgi:hypothetical protein
MKLILEKNLAATSACRGASSGVHALYPPIKVVCSPNFPAADPNLPKLMIGFHMEDLGVPPLRRNNWMGSLESRGRGKLKNGVCSWIPRVLQRHHVRTLIGGRKLCATFSVLSLLGGRLRNGNPYHSLSILMETLPFSAACDAQNDRNKVCPQLTH